MKTHYTARSRDGVIRHLWNGNTCSKCNCVRRKVYHKSKPTWHYTVENEDKGAVRPNCIEKPIAVCGSSEYHAIHIWLKSNCGKASKCENENCTRINPKRYEWALKKGLEHKRDRDHYIQLCTSCHKRYDMTDEFREKISKRFKGVRPAESTIIKRKASLKGNGAMPVIQKTIKGFFVRDYESISAAAKDHKTNVSCISNALNGKTKTSCGYLWEYKGYKPRVRKRKSEIKIIEL